MTTREEAPLAVRGILFDGSAEESRKSLKKSLDRKKVFEVVRGAVGVVGSQAWAAI